MGSGVTCGTVTVVGCCGPGVTWRSLASRLPRLSAKPPQQFVGPPSYEQPRRPSQGGAWNWLGPPISHEDGPECSITTWLSRR